MTVTPKHHFLYSCPQVQKQDLFQINQLLEAEGEKYNSSFHKQPFSTSPPKFLKLYFLLSHYLWLPFFPFTAFMIRNILFL